VWSRDIDPRPDEPDRPEAGRGGRAEADPRSMDPRHHEDVFSRDLDLPQGRRRELIRIHEWSVALRGSESRLLATVGAFRVIPSKDLRHVIRHHDLRHLREAGLIECRPYVDRGATTQLVSLTERGRELLEARCRAEGGTTQTFHAGIVKPRELAHDAQLYRAYVRAAERIRSGGGRVRRVVLDYELKRDYQRFLHRENRRRRSSESGGPMADAVKAWAIEHDLPYLDGHVRFPDVRVECEREDGCRDIEDVEVMTPHYRGAYAANKARTGFSMYRSTSFGRLSARTSCGGRRPFDPRAAEEVLS
jgi:hypothetical protein